MHRSEINAFLCSITSISEVSTVSGSKKRKSVNLKILFYVYELFVDDMVTFSPLVKLKVIYSLQNKNLSHTLVD